MWTGPGHNRNSAIYLYARLHGLFEHNFRSNLLHSVRHHPFHQYVGQPRVFIDIYRLIPVYQVIIYIFIALVLLVAVILLVGMCCHRSEITLSVQYISEAANILWESPSLIIMSIVFILLLAGLTGLCIFQVLAYWSASKMVFYPTHVYYRPQSTFATIMTTLCVIEFIWGLCFLKETCKFIIIQSTSSFQEWPSLNISRDNAISNKPFAVFLGITGAASQLAHFYSIWCIPLTYFTTF